jgi:hypothetical protein
MSASYAVRVAILVISLKMAYQIRLFAVSTYGMVIHEYDPWFNFRATEYLVDHGWSDFSTWVDRQAWWVFRTSFVHTKNIPIHTHTHTHTHTHNSYLL